jgi:hypothetical protein
MSALGRAGGWEMVRLGLVRLGYMETFSCKPREIDEKFPNFFVVGFKTPSQFLSALMT